MKLCKKCSTIISLLTLFLFVACAPSMTKKQRFDAWFSTFPAGFEQQIEVSYVANNVYHEIADTPIKELQTEAGAQRIGHLVTNARDKYRHWQSYGSYVVPRHPHGIGGVNYASGLEYIQGEPGKQGNALEFVMNLGLMDGSQPSIEGTIKSSRGKVIFGGRAGDERNWHLYPPFDDILRGDRVANIPNLIGRIKR